MIEFEVSEGIFVNKAGKKKESDICLYFYFSDKRINLQPNVYNECYNVLMMFVHLSDIADLNIHGDILNIHRCIITGINKSEVIDLLQDIDLSEKRGAVYNVQNFYHM